MSFVKCILFDFDGTLINSMSDFAQMASQIMVDYYACQKEWAIEHYRKTSGKPFYYQLESLFPNHSLNKKAHETFDKIKLDYYKGCSYFNDAKPFLEDLKSKEYTVGISSNNDKNIIEQALGDLKGYFDFILGYEDGFLKGKDHFSWISQNYNFKNEDIMFIGDSLHDATQADQNKIPFIAREGTFHSKKFLEQGIARKVIRSFDELRRDLDLH